MNFNKKIAVAALSVLTALTIGTSVVYAEPTDDDLTADEPDYSQSDVYDEPVSSDDTYTPPESSSSYVTPDTDYSTSSSYSNDDYYNDGYNDSYNTDNYYSNDTDNTYEYQSPDSDTSSYGVVIDREPEFYESGTMGEDSTQPVVDNKLYNASSDISSDEMQADDWDIVLELDNSSGGNDFSFIKDNNSADDSVWYQLILFGGILLITVAVFGVFMIIVMTVKAHKKNKSLARARKKRPDSSLRFETEYTKKDKADNLDTAEIDLSKYDKYF